MGRANDRQLRAASPYVFPRVAGWTTQQLPPHSALLPRHLEAVPPLHGCAPAAAGSSATLSRPYGRRGAGFLDHSEKERHVSIGTRNCRLAALRSFFCFVADREPLAAGQCAEVLRIPIKRGPRRRIDYLESAEVAAILAEPNRQTLEGQRDHALLALLYNTGARIQEALDLCPQAVRLESPAHVRLVGKGRKERLCPIWPETAELLTALLRRQPRASNEAIFVNRYGRPLGASGFRFQLRQYVQAAAKKVPTLAEKRVSPHLFRHSAAVHLVAAGVDITVIHSWMGHAHLDTTNLYAQANLETKRQALNQLDPGTRPRKHPRWKQNDILSWLSSR